MSDLPAPDPGFSGGGSNGNGHGNGGGSGSWFRGFQRSRTPTAATGGVAAYDGWNGDDAPARLSSLQDHITPQQREQAWERLDREREQKAQYGADEDQDHSTTGFHFVSSPSKQNKPARHGITLPQRVSSLLNLSGIGGGGGGGGNEQKSKIASSFKPFVPSGIDPRTPIDNPWQIPAVASAPGPAFSAGKGRKKSFFFGSGDADEDDEEYDSDYFGHRRFPKVEDGNQAVGAWYNPNLMQIVESLQTAMMNKRDPMEHIPVVYNSYVLTLIEAFGKLTTQLQCMESEIAELKNLREKELEEFQGMSEEWIQRENGYKAEIKRLELVLAKESKDGVASVAMARHNSLVDRSGSKRFQARLKRVSGSHQESITEQPITEEVKASSAAHNPTSYRTLDEIPRNMDTSQDYVASRLVEKLEMDHKAREASDAEGVRNNRNPYNTTKAYQAQASQKAQDKKVAVTAHEKSRASKTHRPIPESKGLKIDTALNPAVDDGLTVGRKAYRSATTVNKAVGYSPTGAGFPAQYNPATGVSSGFNVGREALGTGGQKLGFPHVMNRADRRYSFSHGDDEILPVTPSATTFEEAESTRATGVPTGNSSSGRLPGTSGTSSNISSITGLPLSTSTDSTGSVVWLGNTGNLASYEQLGHPANYMGSLSGDVRDGGHSHYTSTSAQLSEMSEQSGARDQAPDLAGSAVYSPIDSASAVTSRDAKARAGSPSRPYASPTIRAVLDVDAKPYSTGERSTLQQATVTPANDKGTHQVLPRGSSLGTFAGVGQTTSDVARIAATRATKRDGQQD